MTTLAHQLRSTRLWLLVRSAAVNGLLSRLYQERALLGRDELAGLLGDAADRRVVIGELVEALELCRSGSVVRFIEAMERNGT